MCLSIRFFMAFMALGVFVTPAASITTITTTLTTTTRKSSTTATTPTSTTSAQCTSGTRVVNGRTCKISCGYDRSGGDYSQSRTGSLDACVQACAKDPKCLTAQYHEDNLYCYFKSVVNGVSSTPGVDTVDCSPNPSPTTTTTTTSKTSTTTGPGSRTSSITTATTKTATTTKTTTTTTTTATSSPTSTACLESCGDISTINPRYTTFDLVHKGCGIISNDGWSNYYTEGYSASTSGWDAINNCALATGGQGYQSFQVFFDNGGWICNAGDIGSSTYVTDSTAGQYYLYTQQ